MRSFSEFEAISSARHMIVGPAHVLQGHEQGPEHPSNTHNEARGIVVVGSGGHDTCALDHPLPRRRRPCEELESCGLRLAACYVVDNTADASRINSSERLWTFAFVEWCAELVCRRYL